jgi:ribosome-associated toxin RatA of RatAB toxin-antitoxin module
MAVPKLTGSSTSEINAPIEQVWELVADIERAPEWQGGLKDLEVLERDDQNRATLCESESDAKVRSIKSIVRFDYQPPNRLRWEQVKGELKSVDGTWELEELDDGRTRATYWLEVDMGRMLGMVIRGPLVDVIRGMLVNARAGELKKTIEGG